MSSFLNQFELKSIIGSGGFGKVSKYLKLSNKQFYAIKEIDISKLEIESIYSSNEVQIMSKLKNTYVVQYYSSWIENNSLFIQMELCSVDLKNVLKTKHQAFERRENQAMSSIEYSISCEIFRQITEALNYLHSLKPEPLIHRDLKPANILTAISGNKTICKLADFGLSKFIGDHSDYHTMVSATHRYRAPEIASGHKYDTKIDVYSLGVIGMELFAFDNQNTSELYSKSSFCEKIVKCEETIASKLITALRNRRTSCESLLGEMQNWIIDYQFFLNENRFEYYLKRLNWKIEQASNQKYKNHADPVNILEIRKETNKNGLVKSTYILKEEAVAKYLTPIKDKNIAVIPIVGPSRKGKSFILNYMSRYLSEYENNNWFGEKSEPLKGFHWKADVDPQTFGIWLSKPHLIKRSDDSEIAVILIDTQGVFDAYLEQKDWSTIVGLSLLMSSCLIFNVQADLQDDILTSLDTCLKYGLEAAKAQEGQTQTKLFQKLFFLIRDWTISPFGLNGGAKFLEKKLRIEEEMSEQAKSNRASIKSAFNSVECFLMPGIGEKGLSPEFNGSYEQLDPKFSRNMNRLIDHLLDPDHIDLKKVKNKELKCSELIHYLKSYVEIFNSDQLPTYDSTKTATEKAIYLMKIEKLKFIAPTIKSRETINSLLDHEDSIFMLEIPPQSDPKDTNMVKSQLLPSESIMPLLSNLNVNTGTVDRPSPSMVFHGESKTKQKDYSEGGTNKLKTIFKKFSIPKFKLKPSISTYSNRNYSNATTKDIMPELNNVLGKRKLKPSEVERKNPIVPTRGKKLEKFSQELLNKFRVNFENRVFEDLKPNINDIEKNCMDNILREFDEKYPNDCDSDESYKENLKTGMEKAAIFVQDNANEVFRDFDTALRDSRSFYEISMQIPIENSLFTYFDSTKLNELHKLHKQSAEKFFEESLTENISESQDKLKLILSKYASKLSEDLNLKEIEFSKLINLAKEFNENIKVHNDITEIKSNFNEFSETNKEALGENDLFMIKLMKFVKNKRIILGNEVDAFSKKKGKIENWIAIHLWANNILLNGLTENSEIIELGEEYKLAFRKCDSFNEQNILVKLFKAITLYKRENNVNIKRAVITVPLIHKMSNKSLIQRTALKVGLEQDHILSDLFAAAIGFAVKNDQVQANKYFLIIIVYKAKFYCGIFHTEIDKIEQKLLIVQQLEHAKRKTGSSQDLHFEQLKNFISHFIVTWKLDQHRFDEIVLAGHTVYFPGLTSVLREYFCDKIISDLDPQNIIIIGCHIFGKKITQQIKSFEMIEMIEKPTGQVKQLARTLLNFNKIKDGQAPRL